MGLQQNGGLLVPYLSDVKSQLPCARDRTGSGKELAEGCALADGQCTIGSPTGELPVLDWEKSYIDSSLGMRI